VLATPHLLLSSGLEAFNPGGGVVGRYLLRHCNAMTFGFFDRPPNPAGEFHKQLGVHDFYFGDPGGNAPEGKLGCIQQVMAPPAGSLQKRLGKPITRMLEPAIRRVTGLLSIAEDQPSASNRLIISRNIRDRYGLPRMIIEHDYSARDLAARRALVEWCRRILRGAGARFSFTHHIDTFSHAVGTVRAGVDPSSSALDAHCRFRGVDNVYVVDGSFMPTSAAVNPSLTIAANALRTATRALEEGR
jgi:choline dehydrogenase-like flavoprotein